MPKTIGSFEEFQKLFPQTSTDRQEAVKTYLEMGIITVKQGKISYPNPQRLEKQIRDREEKLRQIYSQLKAWDARQKNLKTDKATDSLGLWFNPVYWQHQLKLATNQEYKEVYELVEPPMHLLNRNKWDKRLAMFVKSKEYRDRLKEARLSKIGKKREKMTKEVEGRLDFNRQMASTNRKKLEEKKDRYEREIDAMRTLMAWVRESKA
jgi:hypothetical protein